jgi:hypothetical protein
VTAGEELWWLRAAIASGEAPMRPCLARALAAVSDLDESAVASALDAGFRCWPYGDRSWHCWRAGDMGTMNAARGPLLVDDAWTSVLDQGVVPASWPSPGRSFAATWSCLGCGRAVPFREDAACCAHERLIETVNAAPVGVVDIAVMAADLEGVKRAESEARRIADAPQARVVWRISTRRDLVRGLVDAELPRQRALLALGYALDPRCIWSDGIALVAPDLVE